MEKKMSQIPWTKEQKSVINTSGKNILVAAGAGSGKTAVLVERIIKKVTNPENPVDIDQLKIRLRLMNFLLLHLQKLQLHKCERR